MSSLKRFGIPVILVGIAYITGSREAPFPLLLTAITISAWWFGTIAGLWALTLSMTLSLVWIHPWYDTEPAKYLGFLTGSGIILFLNYRRAKAEKSSPVIDHQLSEIAHRLSTIITAIIGYAELAIGDNRDGQTKISELTVEAREAVTKLYWFARSKEQG